MLNLHLWVVAVAASMTVAACASAGEGSDAGRADSARIDAGRHDAPAADGRAPIDSSLPVDAAPIDSAPMGSCATPSPSGAVATYSFTGATGSQVSTAVSSVATGVTATAISRASGLTAMSGTNSINSANWPTTAQVDLTKYYTLTVTPPAGCELDVTALAIDAKASGSGPTSGSVATSADAFGTMTAVSTAAPSTPTLAVTNDTGALEIRIYGYDATSTNGTLRVQNTLTVTGTIH